MDTGVKSRDAAQGRRARLILLRADGERYGLIRNKLDCDTNFIARWKIRFVDERVAGLYSPQGGRFGRTWQTTTTGSHS